MNKYNPVFKVVKSDVTKSGETVITVNLIEDESSQLDITTFILDDRNYKNKIIKLIKRTNKYNPVFKVVKSDISKSGESIITINLINPNTKEVISEGKGKDIKKAEQDTSKNALIKMGYF